MDETIREQGYIGGRFVYYSRFFHIIIRTIWRHHAERDATSRSATENYYVGVTRVTPGSVTKMTSFQR
eukprot:scaffold98_cov172-Amphora_coffeaeformis.AAC.29